MNTPLVSVICLCHNHALFVKEALESVLGQSYPAVELIIVDDHSTDGSGVVIRNFINDQNLSLLYIPTETNLGNCRAFNLGWRQAKGEFVIDLAADDILMPDRIAKGIESFMENGSSMGVHFSDAIFINEADHELGFHSDRFPHNKVAQGDVYVEILKRYFICSPTMMFRSAVLTEMGGYDETLTYEDFDFWIRSSRHWKYYYSPEPLVKRRVLDSSLGRKQHLRNSGHWMTTFRVLEKARSLNKSKEERAALRGRILYESRRAFFAGEWNVWRKYFSLIRKSMYG